MQTYQAHFTTTVYATFGGGGRGANRVNYWEWQIENR